MNPLEQLRDLHLPDAPGSWPPAPGWWFLTLILLLVAAALIRLALKKHRASHYRRQALSELSVIAAAKNPLPELLVLVRRTAKTACPESNWPSLSTEELLIKIDAGGHDLDPRKLASYLYARTNELEQGELDRLIALIRTWLRTHRRGELC